jgi:hypothetical protein
MMEKLINQKELIKDLVELFVYLGFFITLFWFKIKNINLEYKFRKFFEV